MQDQLSTPTQAPAASPSVKRTVKAYIAARGQDQKLAAFCRQQLEVHGVISTARWIDEPLVNESHDEAQMDLDDVRAAQVLIVIKPKTSHNETTGGHHVETGVALERGIPIVLLGDLENVFHRHESVYRMEWPVASWADVALVVGLLANPEPAPAAERA